MGLDRAKGTHKPIIDLYNKYIKEHPGTGRSYLVTYKDAYCATTVSAAFIKLGAVDLIGGVECGIEEFIKIFKKKGIWNEDGAATPKPGWIVCYNWEFSGIHELFLYPLWNRKKKGVVRHELRRTEGRSTKRSFRKSSSP